VRTAQSPKAYKVFKEAKAEEEASGLAKSARKGGGGTPKYCQIPEKIGSGEEGKEGQKKGVKKALPALGNRKEEITLLREELGPS